MKTSQKLKLATLPARRIGQQLWQSATGSDVPIRPYYASIDVTYRCNLKCVHCSLWERPWTEEQMTLDELKDVVLKLKNWLNMPALDILGGEPFLRPDTIDLIRFATEQDMILHIVTNGTMLNDKLARELIELGVYKIAISMDGFSKDTHDVTRGVDGALKRTMRGVERLKRYKDELGGDTRISIHTILDSSTMDEIPALMDWVVDMGLDGFHLIPLDQDVGEPSEQVDVYDFDQAWHERNPLWIHDHDKLEKLLEYVIKKKHEGYPVADPDSYLRDALTYFREPGGIQHSRPCRAGSELVNITPKGGVIFCPYEEPVGNLRTDDPDEVWRSVQAAAAREKVGACTQKCFFPFCSWNEKERAERFVQQFVKKAKPPPRIKTVSV